jgi:hypothetical protein
MSLPLRNRDDTKFSKDLLAIFEYETPVWHAAGSDAFHQGSSHATVDERHHHVHILVDRKIDISAVFLPSLAERAFCN